MKTVATPGYTLEAGKHPEMSAALVAGALINNNHEPSMIVVDPDVPNGETVREDEGRTAKIHGPFKFWVMRDDHNADCDCGCDGGSIVTYLLPEE